MQRKMYIRVDKNLDLAEALITGVATTTLERFECFSSEVRAYGNQGIKIESLIGNQSILTLEATPPFVLFFDEINVLTTQIRSNDVEC